MHNIESTKPTTVPNVTHHHQMTKLSHSINAIGLAPHSTLSNVTLHASVQAPAWLHPITDLQTAASIEQLQGMITQPSRYDYTYLAAALHRLSELTEQQRQLATAAADPAAAAAAARAELAVGNRLAKKLYGRLQQLAQDGSAGELACVLAAAARLGTLDGETYAAAATAFANGPQLQQASDTQLAAVMYAVAAYSSSCTAHGIRAQGSGFPKQQQHAVLKACATQVFRLLRQQQQAAAASGAVAAAAAAAAADAAGVQPSTVVMTVWALSTAGVKVPQATAGKLFGVLGQPSMIAKLTGSFGSSSGRTVQQQQQVPLDEVARTCCTVLWAAAQLQFVQPDLSVAKAYVDGFMRALPAVPVACSSITTVLQALASLLAAARQQQQQQRLLQHVVAEETDYWRSVFLRCSDEVVRRLQQQQQTAVDTPASSSSGSTVAADIGLCAASTAYQVVWSYHVAGISLPDSQLQALLALLGEQVSKVPSVSIIFM
jgi:hypothetical protein